jgi:hypothetical protein
VLKALSDNNRSDVIAQIASQTTSPSYGYLANSGRTTLTESMAGDIASSQFHMMYGHIEEWFYYAALGIAPNTPGYAEIRFRPEVAGTLKSATGYVQTKNGKASSSWTYANKIFDQDITIPAGSTGLIYLPSVGSGVDSAIVYAGTTNIWKNRAAAGSVSGVTYDSTVNNYLVWHVTAGTYHFRLGPPNTPPPTLTITVVSAMRKGSLGFTFTISHAKQHIDIAEVQSVRIYDLAGKTVRALEVAPHSREASWNGRDAAGTPVNAGIYLVRFFGNGEYKTIKVRIR